MRAIAWFVLALEIMYILNSLLMNVPAIAGTLDGTKYVEGEVFVPVDGKFDFRKFSISCPQRDNFTTFVYKSGYAQFVDNDLNYTINIFEWGKMSPYAKEWLNSSFVPELEKPNRTVDGICVFESEFFSNKFYSACVDDPYSDVQLYIATPSVNETVALVKSVEFKDTTLYDKFYILLNTIYH